MPKIKHPSDVVQTAITMERQLKERYSKLAFRLDLNFSQLVRFALRHVEDAVDSYEDVILSPKQKDITASREDLKKAKNM